MPALFDRWSGSCPIGAAAAEPRPHRCELQERSAAERARWTRSRLESGAGPSRATEIAGDRSGPSSFRPVARVRAVGKCELDGKVALVDFDVTIEIPKGSRNKYEVDHHSRPDPAGPDAVHRDPVPGRLRLHRRHPRPGRRSARRPGTAGRADLPGCLVTARAIGMFRMTDEAGPDDKVLCVSANDPRQAHLQDIGDLGDLRETGDPALLRGLQGSRAGQERRGRELGRPRRGGDRDRDLLRPGEEAAGCRGRHRQRRQAHAPGGRRRRGPLPRAAHLPLSWFAGSRGRGRTRPTAAR